MFIRVCKTSGSRCSPLLFIVHEKFGNKLYHLVAISIAQSLQREVCPTGKCHSSQLPLSHFLGFFLLAAAYLYRTCILSASSTSGNRRALYRRPLYTMYQVYKLA